LCILSRVSQRTLFAPKAALALYDLLKGVNQRHASVMVILIVVSIPNGHGIDVAGIFWGLWLFPLGLLVYRSSFLPRILGVVLMINCFAYPVNSFTSLLLPQYEKKQQDS
jgi:hypothetical protein